jgi:hypothetical protein
VKPIRRFVPNKLGFTRSSNANHFRKTTSAEPPPAGGRFGFRAKVASGAIGAAETFPTFLLFATAEIG